MLTLFATAPSELPSTLGDESSVVALAEEGRLLNDKTAHWPRLVGDSHMRKAQAADAAQSYAIAVQKHDASEDDWAPTRSH